MTGRAARYARLATALACASALVGCTSQDPVDPTPFPEAPTRDVSPAIPPTTPASADAWEARADAPVALTEVAVAAFEGRLWVAGGLTLQGLASDAVQVYDPSTDTWAEGPALPEGVHHSTLVATDDALLLVGGYTGATFDQPTTAVRRLDGDAWVDGPPLPEARGAGAGAWDGARVVYGGGVAPGGRIAGEVVALEGDAWRTVGALAVAREHLAAAGDGAGQVWFVGGRAGSLESNMGAVEVVVGDAITDLGATLTPRGGVAAFVAPDAGACLVGGEGPTGTFAEVECVDAAGTVTVLPPLASARHGLGAAVIDGVAYAALGGTEPGLFTSATLEALPLS